MARNTNALSLGPSAQAQIAAQLLAQAKSSAPKPSKYGNIKTAYRSTQGFERKYDSIAEATHAAKLDFGIKAGLIKLWLPQPAFPLIGGVVYRADFMVVWADGHATFEDVKGFFTASSRNKIKQVEATYPVTIDIVRRA